MRKPIEERANALGLGASLAEVRILPFSIAAFVSDRAAMQDEIARAIEAFDAPVVFLGGAPFAGLGRAFAATTGRVVIDGVEAAVATALAIRLVFRKRGYASAWMQATRSVRP